MGPLFVISGYDFDHCTCNIGLYVKYGYALETILINIVDTLSLSLCKASSIDSPKNPISRFINSKTHVWTQHTLPLSPPTMVACCITERLQQSVQVALVCRCDGSRISWKIKNIY